MSHCINVHIINRTVVEEQKGKNTGSRGNAPKGRGGQRHHDGENEGFNKGTAKPNYARGNYNDMGSWKQEDTQEKARLKEKAVAMHKKVTMAKNEAQKIRLILNVITPDNYEKKFNELRQF